MVTRAHRLRIGLTTLLACVATIALTAAFVLPKAYAETLTWTIGEEGDGTNVVATLDRSTGELIIAGHGKMKNRFPWTDGGYAAEVKTATFAPSEGKIIAPYYTDGLFDGCSNMVSVDISKLDTSQTTMLNSMFNECSSLASLDLSTLDTSNVTDMGSMFSGCSSLTSLDITPLDTSKATYMGMMFSWCQGLTSLDLSTFDTSNVTEMSMMFTACTSLTDLNVSSFDTSKVTGMMGMFNACFAMRNLDISSFDTSSVKEMRTMFGEDPELQSITFGEKFKFVGDDIRLTTPKGEGYTGKWTDGARAYTAAELTRNPAGGLAGTWTWEKGEKPAKAAVSAPRVAVHPEEPFVPAQQVSAEAAPEPVAEEPEDDQSISLMKLIPNLATEPETVAARMGAVSTMEVQYDGDGVLSVVSSDETIVKATLVDKTVSVEPVSEGTAKVTVSASEGAEYQAADIEVPVEVSPADAGNDAANIGSGE